MYKFRFVVLGMVILCLSGCGKFDIIHEPVPEILQAEKVCIIDHVATRETFRTTLKQWLRQEGITPEMMPDDSGDDVCEWTLRYYGKWSWDVALYLADTQITAYHDGLEAGRVGMKIGQFDAYKWENGQERIFKLMDMLSGKVDQYKLNVPEKKNK